MDRLQIVCIGASTVYGVGGATGGWADLLKRDFHKAMYQKGGTGEWHEVYNLGVPGADLAMQRERVEVCLRTIRKPGRKLIVLFQGGSNNAKAVDRPDNFVSTPEEYRQGMVTFLELLRRLSDGVICLGMLPMNQDKVMPIEKDREKNSKVYFPNERIRQFEAIFQEVATSQQLAFVPLFEAVTAIGWTKEYQYEDGIHPNDRGHEWLCQSAKQELQKLIGSV